MSNILLYRQFFFHSLTFCPMDNRSTFFCPLYPRHILPSFPVVTAGDLCLHSLCMLGRIIHGISTIATACFYAAKVRRTNSVSSTASLLRIKFDANFPQSQIAAFHKILTSVPCLLFLLSPLGIARKINPLGEVGRLQEKGNKKQNNDSNRTDYRHS